MTDLEFCVLDELYFVIHFDELVNVCDVSADDLVAVLKDLYRKQWIRIMHSPQLEVDPHTVDLDQNFGNYYFLASKKGLFAHNSTT